MKARIFSAVCILISAIPGTHGAEIALRATTISPSHGQSVKALDEVTVELAGPNLPIVAVRSKQKNSLWWIQTKGVQTDSGRYHVNARFGDAKTPNGREFEIAVWSVPDAAAAEAFKSGDTLKRLPSEFPPSAVAEVVLQRTKVENPLSDKFGTPDLRVELQQPSADGTVRRLQRVVAESQETLHDLPLVLVRAAERNSKWWVQDAMHRRADGKLEGLARFGNAATPVETRFFLMLAQPREASAARYVKSGDSLSDLSRYRCSDPITVALIRP